MQKVFNISKNIPSSQPHLNPCQPCSQRLSVPSDDHRDTLSYDATLTVLQDFQQYPISSVGSTIQANQLHLPQSPSYKPPLCPTHIHVQSIPHYNNNKAVQYDYSVELQHLPTLPTSPTLLQEIHTRPGEVVDLGVIDNTEERKISILPFSQEDKINLKFLSFDEEATLEPKYSL